MAASIETAFASLDRFAAQLPMPVLLDWLRDWSLGADDLLDYLVFRPDRYVRNKVHDGPAYQALVLCWRNGQRSPIHNHRGSHCAVKVLRGIATETLFARAANRMIYAVNSRALPSGHICASTDEDIHQISNLQADNKDLVTLHVYSPPLLRMEMFSLESPVVHEWDDPINDPFAFGI